MEVDGGDVAVVGAPGGDAEGEGELAWLCSVRLVIDVAAGAVAQSVGEVKVIDFWLQKS